MYISDLSWEMRDLNPVKKVKGDDVGEAEGARGCKGLVGLGVLRVSL